MKILTRYVLREFLRIWAMIFAAFAVLYVIVDFFEKIGRFARYDPTVGQIAAYFLYKLPLILLQMLPVSVFLAALLSFAVLAKNQEITAARAGGVSIRRLALPMVLTSFVFAALAFAFDQTLVPTFTDRSDRIYQEDIRGRRAKQLQVRDALWTRSGRWFFHCTLYDPAIETLKTFQAWAVEDGVRVSEAIEAREAHWEGDRWVAVEGVRRRFGADGSFDYETFDRLDLVDLVDPSRLKVIGKDAEAMTAAELLDNIARLREAGEPTAELEVDFHEKLAVSFAPIITVLLGVPFGLKGSRSGGLALGILYAVILLFGYYVVLAWGIALGHAGTLSPPVAGWAATMFFGLMGAYLFARVER